MNLLILRVIDHLDRVVLGNLIVIRTNALDLNDLELLARIAVVAEDERAVLTHSLLTDDDALTTLYDEIATEIIEALAELGGVNMLLVMEKAVLAADHYRDLTEVYVRKDTLSCRDLSTLRVVNHTRIYMYIYEQRRSIGQIPHARIIGHHGKNRTIVLKDGGLS